MFISTFLALHKYMSAFQTLRFRQILGRWFSKQHDSQWPSLEDPFDRQVSIRFIEDMLIITPRHHLDHKNCLNIQRILSSRSFPPVSAILFDLSRVTAIDSIGLGLISYVAHSQRRKNQPTHVAGPPTHVLELLKKAKLTEMVTIAEQ